MACHVGRPIRKQILSYVELRSLQSTHTAIGKWGFTYWAIAPCQGCAIIRSYHVAGHSPGGFTQISRSTYGTGGMRARKFSFGRSHNSTSHQTMAQCSRQLKSPPRCHNPLFAPGSPTSASLHPTFPLKLNPWLRRPLISARRNCYEDPCQWGDWVQSAGTYNNWLEMCVRMRVVALLFKFIHTVALAMWLR